MLLPIAGVVAIILVCWLAGGTVQAEIADAEAARAHLRHAEPDFAPARVLLAGDRRVALVADDTSADIAAVMAFGDTLVSRRFARGGIRAARLSQRPGAGHMLTVLTGDPTCRRIDMVLHAPAAEESSPSAEPAESIGHWLAALERLMPSSARPAGAATENA